VDKNYGIELFSAPNTKINQHYMHHHDRASRLLLWYFVFSFLQRLKHNNYLSFDWYLGLNCFQHRTLKLINNICTTMIGRVGFSCDILFSVSSNVSNIINIYPLTGIAWPFLFHSYLGLLIYSHTCNRSSSQLYWSWSLLSWSVIGIARSHACIKCEVMPFFSVHN
jgi:hypothetical protein